MAPKSPSIPAIARPSRLPDQVAEYLAAEIRKGAFRPGQRLPPETALAEKFAVSRTVIREALAKLKYDGLLTSRQGIGATIVGTGGAEAFRLRLADEMDATDLSHLYELRAVLEGDTAFLAAGRRTRKDVQDLRRHLRDMERAVARQADGTASDSKFHQAIAAAAKNPYLQDLTRLLTDKLRSVIQKARNHSSRRPDMPVRVQQEHQAIYEAISSGDPQGARAAVLNHLRNAADRLGLSVSIVG